MLRIERVKVLAVRGGKDLLGTPQNMIPSKDVDVLAPWGRTLTVRNSLMPVQVGDIVDIDISGQPFPPWIARVWDPTYLRQQD